MSWILAFFYQCQKEQSDIEATINCSGGDGNGDAPNGAQSHLLGGQGIGSATNNGKEGYTDDGNRIGTGVALTPSRFFAFTLGPREK